MILWKDALKWRLNMLDKNTKVVVYGFGKQGSFHTKLMKEYGTKIVGIISRNNEGEFERIPFYKNLDNVKADFCIIFVPANFAKNAGLEALEKNMNLVIITEGMKVQDTLELLEKSKEKNLTVIGPNCPGIINVNESKIGIMPAHIFAKGKVGIISRSGTLTYEIVNELSKNEIGQSKVFGIGGDMVIGSTFVDILKILEEDKETDKIILIGEIGGSLEEKAAEYIKNNISKKVVAYIAGRSAPKEKRMGHAGAIIEGDSGSAESKIRALENAGVKVAKLPSEVVRLLD